MNSIKTTIRVLLALTLLISSSGIPVVIHSCGGVVEAIRVFATTASCADDASCEDESCCNNTIVISQLLIDATTMASLDNQLVHEASCMVLLPEFVQLTSELRLESPIHSHSLYQRRPPPILSSMRC